MYEDSGELPIPRVYIKPIFPEILLKAVLVSFTPALSDVPLHFVFMFQMKYFAFDYCDTFASVK